MAIYKDVETLELVAYHLADSLKAIGETFDIVGKQ